MAGTERKRRDQSSKIKVAIRVDAEFETGGGHAYRCLALADALSDHGAACRIVTKEISLKFVPALASSGHELVLLDVMDNDETAHASRVGLHVGDVDLLVVDDYRLGMAFEQGARDWASFIAAIDDAPNRPHSADLLIDQTYGRRKHEYAGVAPRTQILTGSHYALLRKQFARWRQTSLSWRSRRGGRVEKVLVSFGATDPTNCSGLALEILLQFPNLKIDVLVGSSHLELRALRRIAKNHSRVRLFEAHSEVAQLLARADLAIGASGVMSWERCTVGVPALTVILADNQRAVAKSLTRAGAVLCLGEGLEALRGRLDDEIGELSANSAQVTSMSRRAAELCDGQGARRAAEALMRAVVRTE